MSQRNVEIVVGFFKATDVANTFGALSEDVIFAFHSETRDLFGAEELSGKDAAFRWMTDWFSRFRDYQFEIAEALDCGDRVLVVTTHQAKGRTSGAPIRQRTAQVVTVRDGKIVRQDFFAGRDEAAEAVGCRSSRLGRRSNGPWSGSEAAPSGRLSRPPLAAGR
jgi:ketosteroid isomerase-like protein